MTGSAPHVSRVVVAFDGSGPAWAALGLAVDEAAARRVPLHVVSAIDLQSAGPQAAVTYAATAEAAVRRAIARAAQQLGHERLSYTMRMGRPVPLVLGSCRPGDLLVLGSHGHRPVTRMLLGSTSTAVATHAPCPVIVARGPRAGSDGHVLVGVDGSLTSTAAVGYAAEAAARHGATLRAVVAVSPVVDAMGFVSGPDDPALQEAAAVLAEAVAGVRQDHPGLAVEELVVQTHPVEALLRHARGARLVVVGSRGRGGVRAMLLGSVSREMLQRCECPVAVVRPPADAADRASASAREPAAAPPGP